MSRRTTPLPNSKILSAVAAMTMMLAALYRLPVMEGEMRVSFTVLVEAAVGLTLVFALWRYANKWVALFLGLAMFSSFFPFYDKASFLAYHSIFYMVIWYGLVIFILEQESRWSFAFRRDGAVESTGVFLDAICIVALFNVLLIVLQVLDVDPLFDPVDREQSFITGFMANPNEASALLAFAVPAFWRPTWRVWLLVVAAGLVMVKSIGGPLAVGCGAVFYAAMRGRIFWALGLVLAGLVLFAILIEGPGFERWPVWKKGFSLYLKHWILGSGIGHWQYVFYTKENIALFDGWHWSKAHNEILQGLFEMGIGFVIVLGGYLGNVWRRYGKAALVPVTALVIILVNSLVNFPFHIAVTAMIAVTWLAILEIQLRGNAHEKTI